MIKNCLTFSLKYKIKHSDSKIKIKSPLIFGIFETSFNIKNIKIFLKYLKYYKQETGNLKTIFYPHFYIEHNGFNIDSNKRTKILTIEEEIQDNNMLSDYLKEIKNLE